MFKIIGKYKNNKPEEIDEAETLKEANYLVGEYRLAFGFEWSIWVAEFKDEAKNKI